MVYGYISPDIKQRALKLLQEGWDVKEVVEALNVSMKSMARWSGNYGHVVKQSSLRGRRYALNAAALADVTDLICDSPC